jgi:membrane protein DedA with SNARE-associated domain
MTEVIMISILVGNALWFYAGYKVGKRQERIKWNELIKEEILPKPNKKI